MSHSGSNPWRQTSTTQDTKAHYHNMTNVSIPEVNMLKNSSTLVVSVTINLSIKLGFVSVNGPRETYFVEMLCIAERGSDLIWDIHHRNNCHDIINL